jgi:hypothetical protein
MKKNAKKKEVPSRVSPVTAKDFFSSELRAVMEKRRLGAKKESFNYLVELLIRFIHTNTLFAQSNDGKLAENFLVGLYSEYVNGNAETKRQALQRLGDVCLMVTGFFPDSLNRKLVDVDYYSGMGGAAYGELSRLLTGSAFFLELSVKFRAFSNVLAEISERSGLHSNGDLLRMYERWNLSGSERLKELLAEKGIEVPLRFDIKTRH